MDEPTVNFPQSSEAVSRLRLHKDKPQKTAQDWVRNMRMSADVNKANVGVETDTITPELMLATSKKLLGISKQEQEPDPKDSLAFQRFYGPETLFQDHIARDGGKLGRNLLWKATNRGNLDFMPVNALEKHISSVFYDSKLAQMMDGSSPLETIDSAYKTTRIGEGGVSSTDSAPDEMRTVQPSYFGYIDPVRCFAKGTEIKTKEGWKPVEAITKDDEVLTWIDGKAQYGHPTDVLTFDYFGEMIGYNDGTVAFLVTPHHRMWIHSDWPEGWKFDFAENVIGCTVMINVSDNDTPEPYVLTEYDWYKITNKPIGKVYCLTVPGSLVFCRYQAQKGFICGQSPESFRVGLDVYMTKNVLKGTDGKLYQKFIDAKTGKEVLLDSETAAKSVIAAPEMMEAKTKSIFALGGPTGIRIVPRNSVQYYLPRADEAYSTASNLVTMLSGVKEMRLQMGCLHPDAALFVRDKSGMLTVKKAKNVAEGQLAGSTKEGASGMYDVRTSVAKFPPKRNWFCKVILKSGRALITSADHRWPVLRKGEYKLIEASKLLPGDVALRSSFKDVPSRRTFLNGVQVSKHIAKVLGYIARSLAEPDSAKMRIEVPEYEQAFVFEQLKRYGFSEGFNTYYMNGRFCIGIRDIKFKEWLRENMGASDATRKVPSIILSANAMIAAAFLDGYTADATQVGIDSNDDTWVLNIQNMEMRDSIAFLFSRIATDCLYRDAIVDDTMKLAIKLVPMHMTYGDMIEDKVKVVKKNFNSPIMIDIDINDNLYAVANGIITHNSKYPLQAVSLENREAPLVRGLDEASGKDMHSLIGKYLGARYAPRDGIVTAVRKDRIDMLYDDGSKGSVGMYVNFPMNAKGYINNMPQVKAGQAVKKGDLLASSNYTDDKGTAALGTNLKAAWMSWKGGTYEDAIVISESAAKKLTSTTMYKTAIDMDKTIKLGKDNYVTWKPSEFSKEQLDLLDNSGIVRPGTVLHKDDPMILAVQVSEPSPGTLGKRILTDVSEKWEHDHPGVVTDVVKTKRGIKVYATVTAPVELGDKLSGNYGNKGEVAQILPDDQMPHTAKGEPLDIIFSPLSLISRTNPSQLHETLLGKIAHKTGKPIVVPAFMKESLSDYVNNMLKQYNVPPEDDIIDPDTGRTIRGVINGYSYIYKLKHLAESKMSARGTAAYDAEEVPGGRGFDSSKRFGTLESSAMAGHQALKNLIDAKYIRGQSNSNFWRSVRTGDIPTMPGEPLVHKKFWASLTGSGINVRKTPQGVSVFALTNGDVDELAGPRELKSRDTYETHNFRPIDGGLFGQDIFGINGDKWGYIKLDEPVPNPVMEEPLARLLGIPEKKFADVASGKEEYNGLRGSGAIKAALEKLNLDVESEKARQAFKSASPSNKDKALKRYVAIERMRRAGVQPAEYMLDKIPVLPPVYRPITSHNGLTMVADSNYLYAQLLDARDDLREAMSLPPAYRQQARENLYNRWKELTGLYDPEDAKLKSKHVQGLLKWALGDSPKFSGFQRKVLSSTVDTVGRGVVVPDPRVKLNELGIPVEMAFNIMAPFVERALVKRGYTPIQAMEKVKKQDSQARDLLKEVMATHPVLMNRAPTLHKLGIMAYKPRLVAGHAIHVTPSTVVPFNMDFDGDSIHCEWRVVLNLKELEENAEKLEKSGKKCLTSTNSVVYYIPDNDNHTIGDQTMIAKTAKARFSTAVCSPSELPVVDGSEVKKSDTVTEWDAIAGIYVDTLDLDGNRVLAPVTKISKHEGLNMFDVQLSVCGRSETVVTASEDHSLITLNQETLQLEKTTPADSVGKLVPRLRRDQSVTHETCSRYIHFEKPYEANYDMGEFLGIMIGDGWVDSNNSAIVACCDESLQKEILRLSDVDNTQLPVLSKTYVSSYKSDATRLSQNDRQIINLHLEGNFKKALKKLIGDGAFNKRIPTECFRASRAHRIGLIMGLLATDGTVTYAEGTKAKKAKCKTVLYHTTSPELRDGIAEICSTLGIRTSVTLYNSRISGNTAYAISLSIVDIVREATHNPTMFVVPCSHKQEALQKIIKDIDGSKPSAGTASDIVPFPYALGAEFSWAKVANPGCITSWRNKGYIGLDKAREIAAKLRAMDWTTFKEYAGLPTALKRGHTPEQAAELVAAWCAIVDKADQIAWVHVDSVTPSTCTVGWDCTVPGPYTFSLYDGTIVQDTVNVHVPVSDAARKEAYDRMMPERNLVGMRKREILYKPEKEYQQGLYIGTRMKKGDNVRTHYFNTLEEARKAFRDGIIDIDDPIEIKNS